MEYSSSSSSSRAFSPTSSFESLSTSYLEAAIAFPKYPSSSHTNLSMAGPIHRFFPSSSSDGAHHFLDSCHLCKKPLAGGDIYMYRGDTPFCSEECRQEQMEMDVADERRMKRSQKQQQNSNSSETPSASEKIRVRVTGTVFAS